MFATRPGPKMPALTRSAALIAVLIITLESLPLHAAPPAEKPAAVDCHGDPLPEGAVARLGSVRFRQPGQVVFLAFSPDGKLLASAGSDGTFRLWDVASGRPLQAFLGLVPGSASAAFSPDSQTFTFVGRDRHLHFRDVASGKDRRTLALPTGGVSWVALSPDGKMAAVVIPTQTLRLWDLVANRELRVLVSPAAKGQKGPVQRVLGMVAFSPDGKRLAAGSVTGRSVTGNQTELLLWDLVRGGEPDALPGPPGLFATLVFAPAGRVVAMAGQDQAIHLLDLAARKVVSRPAARGPNFYTLAFAPDGQGMAVSNGAGVDLVDPATGNVLRRFSTSTGSTPCVAFSADGKTLATAGPDARIRLWDPVTGQELRPRDGHAGTVGTVVYAPDGKSLATSGSDALIRLWDLATGRQVRRYGRPGAPAKEGTSFGPALLAFGEGGKVLAALWPDGVAGRWDVATAKELPHGSAFEQGYQYSALSLDGAMVARVRADGAISVWDLATGQELRRLGEPRPSPPGQPPAALGISALTFAPDARTLATGLSPFMFNPNTSSSITLLYAGGMSGTAVKLWEVVSGKDRGQFPVDSAPAWPGVFPSAGAFNSTYSYMAPGVAPVYRLVFSPDSRILAIPSNGVRLWDLATRRELRRLDGPPAGSVSALAFSPDGKQLALGGQGMLLLYDVASGEELGRRNLHQGGVATLAFAPDGQTLTTGLTDTTAVVWDVKQLLEEGRRRRADPSQKQLEILWQRLGGADGTQAYQAVWALARSPRRAVPFLSQRVRPVPLLDSRRIARLVAELEHERYAIRQKAMKNLERLGELAEPALRQALAGNPALELRRRAEAVLTKGAVPITDPAKLQALRAVEALEHAGTAEARQVLEELAGGAPEARLTREARAALERWTRQRPS